MSDMKRERKRVLFSNKRLIDKEKCQITREREKAGQVGELGGWVVRSLRCTIWVESDKVEALSGNHMHML
jgi:hypothetical protein